MNLYASVLKTSVEMMIFMLEYDFGVSYLFLHFQRYCRSFISIHQCIIGYCFHE